MNIQLLKETLQSETDSFILFYSEDCMDYFQWGNNSELIYESENCGINCSRILFFKIEPRYHSYLKTFLYFLQILPKRVPEVIIDDIPLDHRIMKVLKEIT